MNLNAQNESGFAFLGRRVRREERIALLKFTMAQSRETPLRIPIVKLEPDLAGKGSGFSFRTNSSLNEKIEENAGDAMGLAALPAV